MHFRLSGLSDEHSSRDTPEPPSREQRELRIVIPRVDEVDSGVNSPRTPQSASTSPAPDTSAPRRHLGTIPRTAGIPRRSRDRARRPRPAPIGEESTHQEPSKTTTATLPPVAEVPEPPNTERPGGEIELSEDNAGLDPVEDSVLAQRELDEFLEEPNARALPPDRVQERAAERQARVERHDSPPTERWDSPPEDRPRRSNQDAIREEEPM
ncbi:hypothetical protein QAD02_007168 [Eretmocerus hayati]|uniref:Uncharacterized protein n=1 Tax=Eretmocerus hayati TaxID=131215 RepID=A0ACC2N3T4_9HYME|nr:hypothetical protein QAD02_007168 [Eretmocerus hayati]